MDVYSIEPMTVTQRLTHTAKYMQELKSWRSQMSNFLDQDPAIAAQLILIYQRQRNVLNLAYWHTVILTNRPLLLSNFARLTSSRRQVEDERKAQLDESAADCLNAAMNIVGIVDMLVQSKQLFRAFWVTSMNQTRIQALANTLLVHPLLCLFCLCHSLCLHNPAQQRAASRVSGIF